MRVLCCESCSSGQRLAAPTERERKKVTNGSANKGGSRAPRDQRRAADPECSAQVLELCVCVPELGKAVCKGLFRLACTSHVNAKCSTRALCPDGYVFQGTHKQH